MTCRVRITTGARLHFGLLDVAAPFGGCGVMIDTPRTMVMASEANEFSFRENGAGPDRREDDHRQRATVIAQRIAAASDSSSQLPPVHVEVLVAAPAHTGLGSGTQLSLAIAEAILCVSARTRSSELDDDVNTLPLRHPEIWLRAADRGKRSAVGTHGYLRGGFIAEGVIRSRDNDQLNPLDIRLEMPPAWRVSVLLPAGPPAHAGAVSGDQEQAKFDALGRATAENRETLVSILTSQLIPAIEDADFTAFCAATTRYNRRSGELFAPVQGGAYNGEAIADLISRLCADGFSGVGQSSWGPGVFVWHPDATSAAKFESRWNNRNLTVFTARPQSIGRTVEFY